MADEERTILLPHKGKSRSGGYKPSYKLDKLRLIYSPTKTVDVKVGHLESKAGGQFLGARLEKKF